MGDGSRGEKKKITTPWGIAKSGAASRDTPAERADKKNMGEQRTRAPGFLAGTSPIIHRDQENPPEDLPGTISQKPSTSRVWDSAVQGRSGTRGAAKSPFGRKTQ